MFQVFMLSRYLPYRYIHIQQNAIKHGKIYSEQTDHLPFSIIPFDPGLNYILRIHESDEQALPILF